ncbi:putative Ig domain-containing protein [Streptacidiphilus fuscans]|uniref:Ig domain-containing protein n=1 Tax=Streptacidiphilus fuscans TaxID=2789292 RepID=A0A931FDG3_9ACTN|nr:putative Ig domain-containing protein [Streptacidiphilus fuscans]MBF9067551.1 putative Ig domain-containing protein [Streptacidiphilus fuscans]
MRNTRFRGAAVAGIASLSLAAAGLSFAASPALAASGGHHDSGQAHHNAAMVGGNATFSNEFNPYSSSLNASKTAGLKQYEAQQRNRLAHQATAAATGQETLSYGGGTDGVGVMSGHVKVYLIFDGNQWGTQSTNSKGDATFSGDVDGAAPVAQEMFKGIGTGGETWSADLTQWCDGASVTNGATSCPTNANFVPYQSGGVLAGVWNDNSAAEPSNATGNQLAQEAIKAAGHFGNTTAASNRYAYYVVLSPHGTDPDGYQDPNTGYCAWHDWNGDTTLSGGAATSPYGDIAFSNQPYNMDAGQNCGVGFINGASAGELDGYTMTLGHEWHEMMSDTYPAGGWTNHVSGSSYNGQENSDECAWLQPGTAGGAANVTMGTGTFAEQASWSNDTNSCAISHTILTHGGGTGGDTVTVTTPAGQNGTVGTAASLQVKASDSATGQTLTYAASGLPAGLSINSSTGLISGTPTAAGTSSVTVTVTDGTGAKGTATFSWTVAAAPTGCTSAQLLGNAGFETGTAAPWTTTAGVLNNSSQEPAHSGSWDAWLDGYGTAHTDTVSQTVKIPSGCKATLSYWQHIDTTQTDGTAHDTFVVTVNGNTVGSFSNLDANTGYTQESFDLSSYAGQSVTITFTGTQDGVANTSFVIDDTALNVS